MSFGDMASDEALRLLPNVSNFQYRNARADLSQTNDGRGNAVAEKIVIILPEKSRAMAATGASAGLIKRYQC